MQTEGAWWCDAIESDPHCLPKDEETKKKIMADFEEPYGDRRQEIVFIGIGMDQPTIEAKLDECLSSEEEFAKYLETTKQGDPKKQRLA